MLNSDVTVVDDIVVARSRALSLAKSLGSATFLFATRALVVIYQLRFAEQTFGKSYGGLIVILNQITFYILLAELGLAAATTSLLFEPVHNGNAIRVKALVNALRGKVRSIAYWLLPLSCLASAGMSFWLDKQISLKVLAISFLLTCAAAILTFLALPYQSHLNASDRIPIRNVILGCGFILKITVGVVLARVIHSFVGLPLGTALVGVLEYGVQRQMVLPLLTSIRVDAENVVQAKKSINSRARFVFFHRIGYLFLYQSDYIILLFSSSLALLGYYAQYQYIYAGLLSFALSAGGTMTAGIARHQLTIRQLNYPPFYRTTSLYTAGAASVCAVGFVFFVRPAIAILYHSGAAVEQTVILFGALLMLNVLKMNDDIWIDTTGAYSTGYYLPLLEAITYIGLGLIFVHRYQMSGILYTGIVTNVIFSVFFKSFVIGRGVMGRRVLAIAATKMLSLALATTIFAFATLLIHLSRAH